MSNKVNETTDIGEASLILDDGEGHQWHVPFEGLKCVPRVGETVVLPPDSHPHEVLSAEHYFLQQGPPMTLRGEWSSDFLYARPARVVLKVRKSVSQRASPVAHGAG